VVHVIDGPGILRGDEFLSGAALAERPTRAAAALELVGVGQGDTVALLLRNDTPFFEASFAAGTLGASPVPVNWHGKNDEVRFILEDAKAKVLVTHADLLRSLIAAVPDDVVIRVVDTPADIGDAYGVDKELWAIPDGSVSWSEWIESCEPDPRPLGDPLTTMIYTSGTTGRPKGVRRLAMEEGNPDTAALAVATLRTTGLMPGMRTVITGPLYHTAPNAYALMAARLGGFIVLQPRFDPEQLMRIVEQQCITHLHMVPTMFVRVLKLPAEVRSRYDLSSLQHVVHAAAPCPLAVKRQLIDWWGPIIHEYYGGTETGAVVACDSEEWLAHPGTVGKPGPTSTVRIYDEDARVLPPGEVGEIFMRLGGFPDFTYEGRPEARAEVDRDGLVTCGDVGYLDEDGYLYLCDRKRDMVISGGVNIYPAEIEACLLAMDGVRDCAVFGVPDDDFGESLAAAIELEPGAAVDTDGVRSYVRQNLAGFKVPKVVSFHDELPREDSGKIFKRRLRDPYWEGAGRSI
jgi:long-chain acyl-CoA synthetase